MADVPPELTYKILMGGPDSGNFQDKLKDLEKQVTSVINNGGEVIKIGDVDCPFTIKDDTPYQAVMIRGLSGPEIRAALAATTGGNRKTRNRRSSLRKTRRGNRKY
jgi:hypothetical protein